MNLFEGLVQDTPKRVRFNTGTWFDMISGVYEPGFADGIYLNGGLGTYTTALHGRGNTYKSTIMDSVVMGLLRLYPQTQGVCQDTEYSKVKERILRFSQGARFGNEDMFERFVLDSDPSHGVEWTNDLFNQLGKKRKENEKDLLIHTPFLDRSGKPIRVMLPTVVFIDSLSELSTAKYVDFMEDKGLSDDKFRTMNSENGLRKTTLLTYMNQEAAKYGIIICTTARTGDNRSLDGSPVSKELVHQKQKDKIKDVGSKFTTLVHVLTQVQSCKPCLDSSNCAEYPLGEMNGLDLNRVEINSSRNKSNMSGILIPMIVSQEWGLLTEVSYFDFLRTYAKNSIGTGRPHYACPFLPDVKFTRKSLREDLMDNYPLCRALELAAQYRYIQMSWNLSSLPVDFTMDVEKVFDKLTSSDPLMQDILEATSVWAPIDPSKKVKHGEVLGAGGRKHMSLFEVLHKVQKA